MPIISCFGALKHVAMEWDSDEQCIFMIIHCIEGISIFIFNHIIKPVAVCVVLFEFRYSCSGLMRLFRHYKGKSQLRLDWWSSQIIRYLNEYCRIKDDNLWIGEFWGRVEDVFTATCQQREQWSHAKNKKLLLSIWRAWKVLWLESKNKISF